MPIGLELLLVATTVACVLRLAARDPELMAGVKAYWLSTAVAIFVFVAVVGVLAVFTT